jgi:hypothetical protein
MDSSVVDAAERSEPLTGYALVADLMRRQDDVIAEIDTLNDRIESIIREITEARKAEIEANAVPSDEQADASEIPAELNQAA